MLNVYDRLRRKLKKGKPKIREKIWNLFDPALKMVSKYFIFMDFHFFWSFLCTLQYHFGLRRLQSLLFIE